MPWKNRYIGNPILTGILNILFRAGISDAHCGLRALTRSTFDRLQLSGDGMEFASEMVIKAALLGDARSPRCRPPSRATCAIGRRICVRGATAGATCATC